MNNINPKIAAGTIAGALAVLLISALTRYGVDISPTEAGGITVLVNAVIGYLKSM